MTLRTIIPIFVTLAICSPVVLFASHKEKPKKSDYIVLSRLQGQIADHSDSSRSSREADLDTSSESSQSPRLTEVSDISPALASSKLSDSSSDLPISPPLSPDTKLAIANSVTSARTQTPKRNRGSSCLRMCCGGLCCALCTTVGIACIWYSRT